VTVNSIGDAFYIFKLGDFEYFKKKRKKKNFVDHYWWIVCYEKKQTQEWFILSGQTGSP